MGDYKTSEAERAAIKRYKETRDHIGFSPSKADGQRIREAAAAAGMSVQAWILEACRQMIGGGA